MPLAAMIRLASCCISLMAGAEYGPLKFTTTVTSAPAGDAVGEIAPQGVAAANSKQA
jgi:hypothetical protein